MPHHLQRSPYTPGVLTIWLRLASARPKRAMLLGTTAIETVGTAEFHRQKSLKRSGANSV
jgi:hypothetical protein